ncbi:MAG: hypothetical protein E7555_04540 [Ruminococcaceae bacterium]|nr:hypothetical protein [Oscillospiraceae bacterium]
MTKTLRELGEEYLEEIEILDEKIERYRKRLKKAFEETNSDEIFTVQRLLRVFYKQRYEMMETARTLLNYYS